jgi:hypothetical protein
VGTGDFNKDNKTDILWRNSSTGENYVWYMNGAVLAGGDYLQMVADQIWKIVGTGDFNKDGDTDILWRNMLSGECFVWYMNGVSSPSGNYLQIVADLNWAMAPQGY